MSLFGKRVSCRWTAYDRQGVFCECYLLPHHAGGHWDADRLMRWRRNPFTGVARVTSCGGYAFLEQAAYYLRCAQADPDHPAEYTGLVEQFTALAIQSGITPAEAESSLTAALRGTTTGA